jgi:anti-sigma regulatory factor (Ser/Thr protein kinase)
LTSAYVHEERELRIPADLSMLRDVREWAAGTAADFGLPDGDCFQVKLAMSEAVTNAILHGSGSERSTVEITVRAETRRLVFEVADQGRDAATIDPVERLDGGRGLELVSMVMDEVQLTRRDDGTLLRFVKDI